MRVNIFNIKMNLDDAIIVRHFLLVGTSTFIRDKKIDKNIYKS
jgi:hypothetical protein